MQETAPLFHKRLTWVCDSIILNACCLTILQAWLAGADWIWGLSLLNCVAVIALRHWLMKSLQIPWLVSALNRTLKRLADIAVSMLFLLTLFPLIIVIQTLFIKGRKNHSGALFSLAEVQATGDKRFTALVFSNHTQGNHRVLGMTPLVLKLLTGAISLTDLSSLTMTHTEEITPVTTTEESDVNDDSAPTAARETTGSRADDIDIISD